MDVLEIFLNALNIGFDIIYLLKYFIQGKRI